MKKILIQYSCALELALLPLNAMPQNFAIDWFAVDGGGGTSTRGVYTVSGSIGQPDAGLMRGGNFTLNGGFWGIVAAVQMPDAPLLRIVLTTTNTVIVSWPDPSTGLQLQQTTALMPPGITWTDVTQTPAIVNGNQQVTLGLAPGNRYFRLRKP